MKFYQCAHCGNLAVKLHDSGVSMVCCGHPMQGGNPRHGGGLHRKAPAAGNPQWR